MKILKYITVILIIFLTFSCEKFMEPTPDSYKAGDYVLKSRDDFMGVLYATYLGLPTRISFTYEAATDNAITNNENTTSSRAARGGISELNNTFGDSWGTNYLNINRINWYIDRMVLDNSKPIPTPVKFDVDPAINMQTFYFTLGEAFFMRAWYQFDLLKVYGGVADDGNAYGFIITTKYLEAGDDLDLPRNTYQECVDQIAADCDSAIKYLPLIYSKTTGLLSDGVITHAGHASGIAAKALKTRAFLFGASPSYNVDNDASLWDKAANAAADAISTSNGASPAVGFDDLLTFANYFNKAKLNNKLYDNKDIFFRGKINTGATTYEAENYPPRANSGGGTYNPTQDLVDAFPMSDGYPRGTSPTLTYNPESVQTNRDPRLDRFIVRNGESFTGLTISTLEGGLDAAGSDVKATRSGYYLQKHLDPAVKLKTGSVVSTTYAAILLGKPELYLNFAEAALNATGSPDIAIYGFTARQVLAKVRNRALGSATADKYLATVTTKEAFLDVIKNERRCELCFEDFRFWDLRRWSAGVSDLSTLNAPVHSIYSSSPVETRSFVSPYMPIPYSEMLKTKNLVNNSGY